MSIALLLRRATEAALSLLYPRHCAGCNAPIESGAYLCAKCEASAPRVTAPFCRQCSQPFDGQIDGEFVCSSCRSRKFHFESAISAYRAQGVVRDLIHRFKYERHFYLRHQLADWATAALEDERIRSAPFDAFVPVPLHPTRKREREFNQAEVIAELLAKHTGKPLLNILKRIRYTDTQTRHDRAERMENLHGAFRMRQADAVLNRHLLLVDDVFTTGSTVEECARVLKKAGAASVRALVVARR
jgi:ComF family protein